MAHQKPLLSVISPCYNESEVIGLFYNTLRPVLESLDHLDFEMVFVDDGSSDDTLAQLNRFAETDPRYGSSPCPATSGTRWRSPRGSIMPLATRW